VLPDNLKIVEALNFFYVEISYAKQRKSH